MIAHLFCFCLIFFFAIKVRAFVKINDTTTEPESTESLKLADLEGIWELVDFNVSPKLQNIYRKAFTNFCDVNQCVKIKVEKNGEVRNLMNTPNDINCTSLFSIVCVPKNRITFAVNGKPNSNNFFFFSVLFSKNQAYRPKINNFKDYKIAKIYQPKIFSQALYFR
jgi:hypothetical protein